MLHPALTEENYQGFYLLDIYLVKSADVVANAMNDVLLPYKKWSNQ
ncbi:hypothetical protein [Ornithobacterium rhinotracheale]|nr:hypothetical protein [Ornithobacterium rhinotracheale]MCK0194563.1 hypothetical protein [Ornithobacterium rhinotracheale]